ncbi:hypothetical protein FDP41_012056 [Naegleria fowleri]|uniref:Uncharacterized protein n=1 Tax=Naegleria fowleri TaxID=5763 RepID=A0A6A5C9Z3_NAEFO|nr:uncharacterized protein FDP41_012056 [Naegleria fowleri]KAF0982195.1 hypothetical protein FDP41_012056 [Naegleria fowleri]
MGDSSVAFKGSNPSLSSKPPATLEMLYTAEVRGRRSDGRGLRMVKALTTPNGGGDDEIAPTRAFDSGSLNEGKETNNIVVVKMIEFGKFLRSTPCGVFTD